MNYVTRIINFFSITNATRNTTQIESFNNKYNCKEANIEVLTYNCSFDYLAQLDTISINLVDELYARVFVDSLKDNNIIGISQELIDSGIFFTYCLDFIKSNNDYKLYILKNKKNEIIAINKEKVNDNFEEIDIKKEGNYKKYAVTLFVYKQLANYILANVKNSEISNFLVFKKNGYNELFDISSNSGSAEYQEVTDNKVTHFSNQLQAIQNTLANQTKQPILMIDKEDSMEKIEPDYSKNEKNIEGIFKQIALVTGLPDAYLSGKFASSLSGNHSGELEAIKSSIFNFFRAEIIPFLSALGIENNKKAQMKQFIKINNMLELIKDLPDTIKQEITVSSGLQQDIIDYYKGV